MNSVKQCVGLTYLSENDWSRFVDILLDHKSLNVYHANPVVMMIAETIGEEPYWVKDCMGWVNAFNDYPENKVGYWLSHFYLGSDWWYDLYMLFEKDPDNGVSQIFQKITPHVS